MVPVSSAVLRRTLLLPARPFRRVASCWRLSPWAFFLLHYTTWRTPHCSRAPKHREAHERDSGGALAAWGTTAALRRRGEVPWGGTGGRGPDSSRPSDSSCSMASTPVRPVPRAGRSTGGTSTMSSGPEPAYSLARASSLLRSRPAARASIIRSRPEPAYSLARASLSL